MTNSRWAVQILLFQLLGVSLLVSTGCGIQKATDSISDNLPKFEQHVADLKHQLIPIDSLTLGATLGVLEGLTNADGEQNIDSLVTRINRLLQSYLKKTLQELEVPQLGKDLVGGMIDTLHQESDKLQDILDTLTQKVAHDLSQMIDNVFSDLTSVANRKKLSSFLSSIIQTSLADSLTQIVNRSIRKFENVRERKG